MRPLPARPAKLLASSGTHASEPSLSRRALLAGVASLAAAPLAGCIRGGVSEGGVHLESGLTGITLGTAPWPTNEFFYLARERGIFEANGLEVEIQEFSSTTESSNAFAGGELDFNTYASSETIPPFVAGADIAVVIEDDKSYGGDGLVVRPGIEGPEDLRGATIATQMYSVDHMLLLSYLQENGLSDHDVDIVDMTIEESGNAFIAGQCDGASIWDPYLSQARDAGGTTLYTTKDNPNLITDVVCASKTMCERSPEIPLAFVRSFFQAVEHWKANREEDTAYMAGMLGVDAEEFENELGGLLLASPQDAVDAFTPADDFSYWGYTQNLISGFLRELKVIDRDVDCGEMIDDRFVRQVAAETSA